MAKKVTKAVVTAPAPTADVEVVVKPGLGLEDGIVLATTFLLALACTLVILATKNY